MAAPQGGGIQGKLADSEADGGVHGNDRRIIAVGIPVVADIADVRGVAATDGQQPPAAAGTLMSLPLYPAFPTIGENRILNTAILAVATCSPHDTAKNLKLTRYPELTQIIPCPRSGVR